MKFLSEEWFKATEQRVYAAFTKPGKYSLDFCEVYENCPGENSTLWMLFHIEKGIVKNITRGVGQPAKHEYMGIADYKDHVRCCKGQLDPKKAVISGVFKLEDNASDGGPMKTLALINMYMKLTEAKRVPGLEFDE